MVTIMPQKIETKNRYLIGIISDTHGRLPLSLREVFEGVDLIIHAGDVGEPEILDGLEEIAPTVAVRGNMDFARWAQRLPTVETIEVNQTLLLVVHDVYRLHLKHDIEAPKIVISGHTHRPQQENNQGVLHINPGSAGYPKHGQPPTVALLQIEGQSFKNRIIELEEYN